MKRVKAVSKVSEMNRDEARFATDLELMKKAGLIQDWKYQPIKFVLAKRTTYCPDFMVIGPDHIEFVEVKGFLRDDAAVKFKVAAKMFSCFAWRMTRWRKGAWEVIYQF